MATASKSANKPVKVNESQYSWEGKDKNGKVVKGEMRAAGEASVSAHLRRQGIQVTKIKKARSRGKAITEKDITLFTRQLATMLKSGVPLLQAFDIVGKGHNNPSVARMLMDIKTDVETGSSLEMAIVSLGNLSAEPARTTPGACGIAAPSFVTSISLTPL